MPQVVYALKKNNSFGDLWLKPEKLVIKTRALKKLLDSGLCREKGGGKERDCIIQFSCFCFRS